VSSELHGQRAEARAQTIANRYSADRLRSPVTAAHATSGGTARSGSADDDVLRRPALEPTGVDLLVTCGRYRDHK
jgi:hypothetical protein